MSAKARKGPGFRLFSASRFTWDIPSTATLANQSTTVNVPEVKVGDVVLVTPDTPAAGFVYQGYVSAASTVTITAINCTSGTVDPASVNGTVLAIRPTL